jgi:hypothetical protein
MSERARVRGLGVLVSLTATLTLLTCSPQSYAATSAGTAYKRFAALARHGLSVPFAASYVLIYGDGHAPLRFKVWSAPEIPNKTQGDFVYQTALHRGSFRFVRTHGTDYECVQATGKAKWKCVGPYVPIFNDAQMQVEGYRLPMFVGEQIVSDGFAQPLRLFYRVVHGQRLWCLSLDDGAVWCLARRGQFVYSHDPPANGQSNQMEAVSLSLSYSRQIFVLPSRPERLKVDEVPPPVCDGSVYCPSPGPEP